MSPQLCNTLLCGKAATWSLPVEDGTLYKCDHCKESGGYAHFDGWLRIVPAEPVLASRICGLRYRKDEIITSE